jgi:Helix-turn-helix domain
MRRTYSLPEFARLMGICERKVQRLAHDEKIPGQYRKGKRWRVRESTALGKLGTGGSLMALGEAVGKPFSIFGKKDPGIFETIKKTFRETPGVIAADIWYEREVRIKGCKPWDLDNHLSDSDKSKLSMPLFTGISSGSLIQRDIIPLLKSVEHLRLLRDAVRARRKQQARSSQRKRSVGLMGLIAKERGVSRSSLYRELERIVPEGRSPLEWILGFLELMDQWSDTADKGKDLGPPDEPSASPAEGLENLEEYCEGFSAHR